MKLISAKIRNFRLLKKLDLDFSIDPDMPLTVIRAANETGKTTTQFALIWCLYGSKELPQKGGYSLFPSDETKSGRKSIEVSAEIEFELEHVTSLGKGKHQYKKQIYRLIRSCNEGLPDNNDFKRSGESVTLWKVTPTGTDRVLDSDVQSIIDRALPKSLKGVYFTDGDSAMSFIEAAASQGVKRKRVANAIEALLGLNIIDRTISHLSAVSSKFGQEIDDKDYALELEKIDDKIMFISEDMNDWIKELDDSQTVLAKLSKELLNKDSEIDQALKLGDKEKLVKEKSSHSAAIKRNSDLLDSSYKSLCKLCFSEGMATALLSDSIEEAKSILNGLNKSKQLPKVNVPILEELLDRDSCFCGSDLREGSQEGLDRRNSIANAIEASRASDFIQESASSLFYRIRSVNTDDAGKSWLQKYTSESSRLMKTWKNYQEEEEKVENIEKDISKIDDTQLMKLREQRNKLREEQQKQRGIEATRSSQINSAKSSLVDLEEDRLKIRRKLGKTNTSAENWDISTAVKRVFIEIKDRLLEEELSKVSDEMNRIFLSMIGSGTDRSEFSRIQKAELTDEFDIMVYGPDGHILNPDQDLNGASRRAITLAFIIALTNVSEVEAPNIIDTPLGMMSGYVKQSVLLNTVKESSQVILFLTHDEITGVENIIDRYAGIVYTLTNPAHYPQMLVNKVDVDESTIVRCNCNHYEFCDICERKNVEMV